MALKYINPHKIKGNKSWFDYISTVSDQVGETSFEDVFSVFCRGRELR